MVQKAVSIPSGAIERRGTNQRGNVQKGFQYPQVRLKGEWAEDAYYSIKFQYPQVRLKDTPEIVNEADFNEFQYPQVRLKASCWLKWESF